LAVAEEGELRLSAAGRRRPRTGRALVLLPRCRRQRWRLHRQPAGGPAHPPVWP